MVLILFFVLSSQVFAGTATIDSSTKYQTISGFGACSQWVESKITAALATQFWADDNVNGHAGLSIIRIGIPPQGSGNWGAPCNSAKQALAINSNIKVFASPWSPPANYKNNNSTTGNNTGNTGTNPGGNTNQLNTSHYGDYATYLTSFVNACKNTYGFDLYALSVQNEPDYDTSYDSCVWSNTTMDTFIGTNLGPALQAAGYTNIIMMPESFACNLAMSATTMGDANAAKYVKVIGEHLYGGGPNPLPVSYATTAGHPLEMWETEYSMKTSTDDITSGIFYANSLHKCVVDNNYNAWCYWWLVLSSGTDDEGLCDTNGTPTKRLYTLGNYSKFIRPGAVRIAATEYPSTNLATSAYIMTALNRYVIVCVNNNGSAQSTTFNLNGISTSSVTPWLTDASNNLVAQTAVGVSANSFTYNIPANSVMSFVGTMSTGPSPTNTPYAGTPTFTATPSPTPHSVMLDDMEDGDTTNNWGGNWYSYSGTGTTITPKPFTMTAGGMTGSPNYRAEIAATVADYAGMGTNLDASQGAVDLTNYTSVQFYVKGNGGSYWFQFTQPSITDGDNFGVSFTAPAAWTLVTVPIDAASLTQRGYGTASTFTKNAISALQWASNANGALDIQIDNVQFLTSAAMSPTNTPVPPTKTNTPLIPTSTFTATRTATYTYTRTASPTGTSSVTATHTNTAVPPTATNTFTNTPVPFTPTDTRTNTPIIPSATFTHTNTAVPPTFTWTATALAPTQTSTAVVPSATDTVVLPSATATNTVNTATSTAVNTPVNTASPTAVVNTATNTPIAPTLTFTAIPPTATNTQVAPTLTNTAVPPTATKTNTAAIPTATYTKTSTPVIPTATYTKTNTVVIPTATYTWTVIPFTATPSYTATPAPTATATAIDTPAVFKVTANIPYPNPYDPAGMDLSISITLNRSISSVEFRVFTIGFRLIRDVTISAGLPAGKGAVKVDSSLFTGLSNGIYYFSVTAKTTNGSTATSKPGCVVLLRK